MSLRCVDVRAMMGPTAGPILVCAGVCGGALSMIRNPIRARQDLGCKKTKEAQAEVRRKGKRQQSVGKGPLCNKHCLSHQRVIKGIICKVQEEGRVSYPVSGFVCLPQACCLRRSCSHISPSSGGAGEVREAQPRFTPPAPLLRTERQPGDKAPHIWDGAHSNRERSEVRRHRWCYKGYTGVTSTSLGAKLPPPLSTLGCSSVKWG